MLKEAFACLYRYKCIPFLKDNKKSKIFLKFKEFGGVIFLRY